jgi:glutathione synthase/RimK-type ligase-like ATP-grasp enzyme
MKSKGFLIGVLGSILMTHQNTAILRMNTDTLLNMLYLVSIKKPNVFLNNSNINKLIVSNLAKDCGLNLPEQNIVETKRDLEKLLSQNLKVCTKSISGINTVLYRKHFKSLYTLKLKNDILNRINFNNFYPSLIQQYVDKLFEVRSFVLNDRVFSMAIFSQKHINSSDDYRKGYNNVRTCAIKLPEDIESKIITLLTKLNLKSGSIDLIYSKDKKFYFLEVNPSGQFNFLSKACNYNIENQIVKLFLN